MSVALESYPEVQYFKGKERTVEVFPVNGYKVVTQGRFIRTARLKDEYETDISEPAAVIGRLRGSSCPADIFTFWDRVPNERTLPYLCETQTQALLPVVSYQLWWNNLDRRIRKIVRRSTKMGVEVRIVELNEDLVQGVKTIFDETPIKRNKPFWHYNRSLESIRGGLKQDLAISEFLCAFYGGEMIGFIKMIYRDKFADPVLFISKMKDFDKYPNNLLVAKAVERCAEKRVPFIHYSDWRLGTHGDFLRRNGFEKFEVKRYYVPLTIKGKVALWFGLHKNLWKALSEKARIPILKLRGRVLEVSSGLAGKKPVESPSDL